MVLPKTNPNLNPNPNTNPIQLFYAFFEHRPLIFSLALRCSRFDAEPTVPEFLSDWVSNAVTGSV